MDNFTLSRANVANLYISASVFFTFLSLIHSSLPAQYVAILSHTFPRLCHLRLMLPTFIIFWITFHHFCLQRKATISCFSICRLFSGYRLPHSISHRKPIPWLATYFLQSLYKRKASPSVSISSWPYCTFSYDR